MEFIQNYRNLINKKGPLPSLLSPEADVKIFRRPSNNIPQIILMIDDPVIDTPSSLLATWTNLIQVKNHDHSSLLPDDVYK